MKKLNIKVGDFAYHPEYGLGEVTSVEEHEIVINPIVVTFYMKEPYRDELHKRSYYFDKQGFCNRKFNDKQIPVKFLREVRP